MKLPTKTLVIVWVISMLVAIGVIFCALSIRPWEKVEEPEPELKMETVAGMTDINLVDHPVPIPCKLEDTTLTVSELVAVISEVPAGKFATEVIDRETVEEITPEVSTLNKTEPIYAVYAHGSRIDVPAEWQWYIHDLCEEYNYPEEIWYGLILSESGFRPEVNNGVYFGLCGLSGSLIRNTAIPKFTDDAASRDLCDPYDNLITAFELWEYNRNKYGLDPWTDDGIMRLLYMHNTGMHPSQASYTNYVNRCISFSKELVKL